MAADPWNYRNNIVLSLIDRQRDDKKTVFYQRRNQINDAFIQSLGLEAELEVRE